MIVVGVVALVLVVGASAFTGAALAQGRVLPMSEPYWDDHRHDGIGHGMAMGSVWDEEGAHECIHEEMMDWLRRNGLSGWLNLRLITEILDPIYEGECVKRTPKVLKAAGFGTDGKAAIK